MRGPGLEAAGECGELARGLGRLAPARLDSMLAAAEDLTRVFATISALDGGILAVIDPEAEEVEQDTWYPREGDAVVGENMNARFFFHAHGSAGSSGELGHVHTFLRRAGTPSEMLPVALPDYEPPQGDAREYCHLVGISIDADGVPTELFTVNRWVTGETWYQAADVAAMVDIFSRSGDRTDELLERWITGIVLLFHPEIVALIDKRDARIAEWTANHPGVNVYEDRDLYVTSQREVSLELQTRAVRVAALARA